MVVTLDWVPPPVDTAALVAALVDLAEHLEPLGFDHTDFDILAEAVGRLASSLEGKELNLPSSTAVHRGCFEQQQVPIRVERHESGFVYNLLERLPA